MNADQDKVAQGKALLNKFKNKKKSQSQEAIEVQDAVPQQPANQTRTQSQTADCVQDRISFDHKTQSPNPVIESVQDIKPPSPIVSDGGHKAMKDLNSELQAELKQLYKQSEALQRELLTTREQLKSAEEGHSQLKLQRNEAQQQYNFKVDEVAQLTAKVDELLEDKAQMHRDIKLNQSLVQEQLKQDQEQFQQAYDGLNEELKLANQKLDQKNSQLQSLHQSMESAQVQIGELQAQYSQLDQVNQELQNQLQMQQSAETVASNSEQINTFEVSEDFIMSHDIVLELKEQTQTQDTTIRLLESQITDLQSQLGYQLKPNLGEMSSLSTQPIAAKSLESLTEYDRSNILHLEQEADALRHQVQSIGNLNQPAVSHEFDDFTAIHTKYKELEEVYNSLHFSYEQKVSENANISAETQYWQEKFNKSNGQLSQLARERKTLLSKLSSSQLPVINQYPSSVESTREVTQSYEYKMLQASCRTLKQREADLLKVINKLTQLNFHQDETIAALTTQYELRYKSQKNTMVHPEIANASTATLVNKDRPTKKIHVAWTLPPEMDNNEPSVRQDLLDKTAEIVRKQHW